MKINKNLKNFFLLLYILSTLCLLMNNFALSFRFNTDKKNDNININFSQLSMQMKLKIKTFTTFTEEFKQIENTTPIYENFYTTAFQTQSLETADIKNFLSFASTETNTKTKKQDTPNSEEKEETRKIYAYYHNDKKGLEFTSKLSKEHHHNLIAQGTYKKTRYIQGWDKLRIKTHSNKNGNPLLQCYSAGFIEGAISTKEIFYYYNNIHVFFKGANKSIEDIKNFYSVIDQNIRERIKTENIQNANLSDADFKQLAYIACLHAQINGLAQGYNSQAEPENKLTLLDFYFINSEGNFGDLKTYMKVNNMKFNSVQDFYSSENLNKFYNTSEIKKIWKLLIRKGHCSAVLKMVDTPDGKKDIIAGHNTWSDYSEMLRVLKFFSFAFEEHNPIFGMEPKTINYSSYPGVLFSGDDFYLLDSKVGILQTTLSVINKFSYKNLIDLKKYIPEFMRLQITNFSSKSAKEWVDNYRSFPNHMYITQWIVIDYNVLKKLNEGQGVKEGLVYMVEEAPKSILFKDVTEEVIQKGYYGSFNLSYFVEHQKILGMTHYKEVDFFSKEYNPRYYLLQHLQNGVKDLESFKDLIMYNGYGKKHPFVEEDPSISDPSNGISSRDDLAGILHGGIDFKVKIILILKIFIFKI